MAAKGNILVAPLNWGMGHATRCIPVIEELIKEGFAPILASDGIALELLRKEFPSLPFEELPSYNIKYPEDGALFRRKMIASLPKINRAISLEKKITQELVKKHHLAGIISDNRLGVRSPEAPSVIITHQLNLLTGKTTVLSTLLHRYHLRKFDECWVPDVKGKKKSLSGRMGFANKASKSLKYVGPISRLKFSNLEKRYDIMVLLSGPEPQREILENILLEKMQNRQEKILFVKGKIEKRQKLEANGNLKIYNFLLSHQLENAFNSSELVVCRSGYSTIMDLAKLEKKAFFIPTPGQYEQEYLAQRFSKLKIAAFCRQEDFQFEKLKGLNDYTGFSGYNFSGGLAGHFLLFERK